MSVFVCRKECANLGGGTGDASCFFPLRPDMCACSCSRRKGIIASLKMVEIITSQNQSMRVISFYLNNEKKTKKRPAEDPKKKNNIVPHKRDEVKCTPLCEIQHHEGK